MYVYVYACANSTLPWERLEMRSLMGVLELDETGNWSTIAAHSYPVRYVE